MLIITLIIGIVLMNDLKTEQMNIQIQTELTDKAHSDKSHFGLGLSIADELAKMLHGKVGVKDTAGGGATFFVTFPLKTK